jgi:putative oxidoreductase
MSSMVSDAVYAPDRPRAARIGQWVTALVQTRDDRALAILRITLGAVMLPHAAQKVFGWFGGYGFDGTMGYLTGALGLPWLIGLLVIVFEMAGSLALLTGTLGRLGAAAIATVMVGAVVTSHHQFFMNWAGTQGGEGFEYHLLVLAMSAAILVRGSGALSVDRLLARRSA